VKTPITLGLMAALQLLAGLAAQLIVLRIVGIGWQTDAYVAAQTVPLILTAVVAASYQSLWLPRFARAAEKESCWRNELGIALGQTLKIMLLLALPLAASASLWSAVMFPGFSDSQTTLVGAAGIPLFMASVCTALTGVLTAAFRATERFFISEALGLSVTLIALLGITVLVPHLGVMAAAWVSAARAAMLLLVMLAVAQRPPFRFRASEPSREVTRQARPLIGGGIFIKSGPLVDRYWGSKSTGGDITILSVAQLALTALATILERALLAQALPSFAKRLNSGGPQELRRAYRSCVRRILATVTLVAVVLLAIRPVWDGMCATLLRMSAETAWQFWLICVALVPSLFVSVAGSAAVAVFYTFGETRVAAAIGIFGFLLSLILKALLFQRFGIVGIAIGSSLSLTVNMIIYHIAVERRLSVSTQRYEPD
jgi:putative peptidoglycan lipid II flippase